jgi:hypothetical protein
MKKSVPQAEAVSEIYEISDLISGSYAPEAVDVRMAIAPDMGTVFVGIKAAQSLRQSALIILKNADHKRNL